MAGFGAMRRGWRECVRAGHALRWRFGSRDPGKADRAGFWDAVWRETALELGAAVEDLGAGFLEIRRAGQATRVRQSAVMLDDPVTLKLAGNKPLVQRLLARAGLPVPACAAFTLDSLGAAEDFLRAHGGACVVKPARDTGAGAGVTTHVTTRRALWRAALHASLFGRELLVEEQVAGDVYRLLTLDGELLDAVRRRPPILVGDGRRTLRELIQAENRRRLARASQGATGLIALDVDCELALERAGFRLGSRPPAGVRVAVTGISNAGGEAESESVLPRVGKDLRAEAGRAAEALGIRLAGVDVITRDPGVSLHASGGRVTEVNTTPGLHWHYLIRNPEAGVRVAVPILARLLA